MTARTTSCLFGLLLVVLANIPCEASPAKVRSTSKTISPDYTELDLLAQVYGLILSESAEVPDQRKLIKGAINGMLGSLDPHSSYMDPRELKEFNIETGGKFGGIGLEVMMENGAVKVIAPLDDTPAAHEAFWLTTSSPTLMARSLTESRSRRPPKRCAARSTPLSR
jgi:carboxyl-terminal processing protease